MKCKGLLLSAVLVVCVMFIGASMVYAAQGQGQPPGERDFVSDWDKDGDGKVSRMEFPGPNSHFDRLDQNGDGFIDESEAPQGPPPSGGQGGPGLQGQGQSGSGFTGSGSDGPPSGN